MTPAEAEALLAAAEARAEAATEGPWAWEAVGRDGGWCIGYVDPPSGGKIPEGVTPVVVYSVAQSGIDGTNADAAFIAHARTDVPALIALAREQMAGREAERELDEEREKGDAAALRALNAVVNMRLRFEEERGRAAAAEAEVARLREERDRLRARIAAADAIVASLAEDVAKARRYREQKGGQHAGVPRFSTAPPSLLIEVERTCQEAREALKEVDRG